MRSVPAFFNHPQQKISAPGIWCVCRKSRPAGRLYTVIAPNRYVIVSKRIIIEPKRIIIEPKRYVIEPKRYIIEPIRYVIELNRYSIVPKRIIIEPIRYVIEPNRYSVVLKRWELQQIGTSSYRNGTNCIHANPPDLCPPHTLTGSKNKTDAVATI